MITTETWVLPRPRKNKYKGGFPLHFEKKLLRTYNYDTNQNLKDKVLHPFGGMAEYGFRCDINPKVNPDMIIDAHHLPKNWENKWEFVIIDPPYDNEKSKELYNSGKLSYSKYISEAVRVCRPDGFIAMYHWVMTPRPNGCKFDRRIVILTRTWHRPRVCCIFKKEVN